MNHPTLSLMVLRSSRIESSLAFYRELGFSFVAEQHGSGPTHYSTQLGAAVLEIYPGDAAAPLNRKSSGATMLGFTVESVDTTVAKVKNLGAEEVSPPKDSAWGRRAVVVDPDGRAIELNEAKRK